MPQLKGKAMIGTFFQFGSAYRSVWNVFLIAVVFPAVSAAAVPGVGRNMMSLWTCDIPCETDDPFPKPLQVLQIGWCGKSVLTRPMIDAITPVCKRTTNNDKAVARRVSTTLGTPADCVSSGNECTEEGPSTVGYYCVAKCPGEAQLVKFSSCAVTDTDAWIVASEICKGAQKPSAEILGESELCTPNGQTPCTP